MLTTHNLTKIYTSGLMKKAKTYAIHDITMHIGKKEIVGIYGKSGCGKTTLSNSIAGAIKATAGKILLDGTALRYPYKGEIRKKIQMLYQHPEDTFDPCWSLERSIAEPFRIHKIPYTREILLELLGQVGLYEEHLSRGLKSLSGGELQRAALARTISINPRLILLDEPTSMLDVISQAQILEILKQYYKEHEVSYLLISHDIHVIEMMCDRCYFMEAGEIIREEVYTYAHK